MELELAKAIADSGKWEPRAGMAVRGTGVFPDADRYRRHDSGWCDQDGIACDPDEEVAVRYAIDKGPDLTDPVTVFGLLADLPDVKLEVWDNRWTGRRWTCWPAPGRNGVVGVTRTEAIVRAWLAVHGM